MFEEILHNLYRIEIPLPNSPLKTLNSYLIKCGERSLLVDTGMNRKECYDEMLSKSGKVGSGLKKDRFFHNTPACGPPRSCRKTSHRDIDSLF